jgi:hypothetical protein
MSRRVDFFRALAFAFLLQASIAEAATGFGPVTVYPAGQDPSCQTVVDLNEDGIPDLIAVNNLSDDISVLLGNPDGTYQTPINYPVGLAPACLTVSFFNADTHYDVAVSNTASNTVSVLLGNGDGTLEPAVEYSVGNGAAPLGIISSGFTHSGHVDLAIANSEGSDNGKGNVAILLGNGDGTFQPALNLDTAGSQPVALVQGAFNGTNGLAVLNFATTDVTVFASDLNGNFTVTGNYAVGGTGPVAITTWLNRAMLNLVVTNSASNSITILYENGPTYGHPKTYPVGATPVAVAQGIFNQNGYLLDFAVANQGDNTVSAFLTKEFKPYLRKPVNFGTCQSPTSISAAFISSKVVEDLVLTCANGVGVMKNLGQ